MRDLKYTRAGDVFSFGVFAAEVASGGALPLSHLADAAVITMLADERITLPPRYFRPSWAIAKAPVLYVELRVCSLCGNALVLLRVIFLLSFC